MGHRVWRQVLNVSTIVLGGFIGASGLGVASFCIWLALDPGFRDSRWAFHICVVGVVSALGGITGIIAAGFALLRSSSVRPLATSADERTTGRHEQHR